MDPRSHRPTQPPNSLHSAANEPIPISPANASANYTSENARSNDLRTPLPSSRLGQPLAPPVVPSLEALSPKTIFDEDRARCALLELVRQNKSISQDLVEKFPIEDSQCLIDFLNEVLENQNGLDQELFKRILYIFSQVAKFAQVFPARFELQELDFDITEPLFEGGFGYFYEGRCRSVTVSVQVPLFHRQNNGKILRAQAVDLALLAHISHPNIVPLIGVHFYGGKRMCIISPWKCHRDLSHFLRDNPDTSRQPLLFDVICGIRYLHELKVIHSDIKARNIHVSDTGRAMVTDFGIPRVDLTDRMSDSGFTNTLRWTAPELLGADARPTAESDIWSFGCLCYEVLTSRVPFYQYQDPQNIISALLLRNENPLHDPSPVTIPEKMRGLLESCWNRNPEKRPTAEDIVRSFKALNITDSRPLIDENNSSGNSIQAGRPVVEIDYERAYKLLQRVSDELPL